MSSLPFTSLNTVFSNPNADVDSQISHSATMIQNFFVKHVFDRPLLRSQLASNIKANLTPLNDAIAQLQSGKKPFSEAAKLFSGKAIFDLTSDFLSMLPVTHLDPRLESFQPRFRSARAFLSAPMLSHYATECLGKDEEEGGSMARKLMLLSSSFLLTSMVSLQSSTSTSLLSNYNFFKFSVIFLAQSLEAYKTVDDKKVAENLKFQYEECFTMCMRAALDKNVLLEETGLHTLHKMRSTMVQLVGEKKAQDMLGIVEQRVRKAVGSTSRPASPHPETPNPNPATSAALSSEQQFVSKLMANLSNTNEKLAHEIIMDPNYRVPGSSMSEENGEPEVEEEEESDDDPIKQQMKIVKEKMRRVFWDRLITSLTPPTQQSEKDLKQGETVQCRYGNEGAHYSAKIVAVTTSSMGVNYYNVEFMEDNIVEKTVPSTRFRFAGDPLSFRPLLNLIDEVRSKLLEIAPKQQKYVDEIKANMDTELIEKALQNEAYDNKAMLTLIQYICAQLIYYQAPVRNAKTKKFIKVFMEEFTTKVSASNGPMGIALLPRFLEWVFDRIDETKNDIANSHIEMLRPHLKKSGVEYETAKFAGRLDSGQLSLGNLNHWMQETVGVLKAGEVEGGDAIIELVKNKGSEGFCKFVGHAFVLLLRRPVRLDLPQYSAQVGGLPETLLFDARKLAIARDLMDSLALTGTIVTLLRQVLARNRVSLSPSQTTQIQSEILVLLKSQSVNMKDIEQYCVTKAVALCPTLLNEEQVSLKNLISNAAKPDNMIFKLLSRRMDKLVFDSLTSPLQRGTTWGTEEVWLADMIKGSGYSGFEGNNKQLQKMLNSLYLIFSHTLKVHQQWLFAAALTCCQ